MTMQIRVNPVACSGHGAFAELLPERVTLDERGYPVVSARPLRGRAERAARQAVAACPALALVLVSIAEETQSSARN